MFCLGAFLRTVAQETASQTALKDCSEKVRGEVRIYRSFYWKKKKSNIKRVLLITHTQNVKLMTLVLFYVWEYARIYTH